MGFRTQAAIVGLGLASFVCPGRCEEGAASTSEYVLRTSVIKMVRPPYPLSAVRHRQTGVAVSRVYIDDRGLVGKVDILEAPSASIAESIIQALERWEFMPEIAGRGTTVTGKITYYFVFIKGKAVVLEPKDAPYVGRWH